MKREKTPPPSNRPGATRRRKKKASGKPAQPTRAEGGQPDMTGWTEGEKELYRLAISQGKRPIESIDELVFLEPADAEELLGEGLEGRRADAKIRPQRERRRNQ